MRNLILALVVLALIGASNAEWVERLRVQTVDYGMNPISNVFVEVIYQKNLGTGLDGRATGYTNGEGLLDTDLRNFVYPSAGENKVYTVKVEPPHGLPSETRTVRYGDNRIGGVHLEQFRFNTTAAQLKVTVKDQKGNPVEDATVSVKGVSWNTDSQGVAVLGVPTGDCIITASKGDFESKKSITLIEDSEVELELVIQDNTLKVLVTNEYGMPIGGANVSFEGSTLDTNSSGQVEFTGIKVSEGVLTAEYDGMTRTTNVSFYSEVYEHAFVFPSSPLVIDKIAIEVMDPYEDNCTILLSCRARDERVALSEITVNLMYSKDGGEWNSVTEQNELGIFEFEVPCEAPLEFAYMFTALNDHGSMQTPTYNTTIQGQVECHEGETRECTTAKACPGEQGCHLSSWGECSDIPDDGCPEVVESNHSDDNDDESGDFWSFLNFSMPKETNVAMLMLAILGSLAVIGTLGILVITKREAVTSAVGKVKEALGAFRNIDKLVERADKEYEREKMPEKFMKEGKTDEFFGAEEEEKGKGGEKG